MTTQYLKLIGKGQITIPQAWRKLFGKNITFVKASLKDGKMIVEPVEEDKKVAWDIEEISLNSLSKEDKEIIKVGRKAYKKGETNAFATMEDFMNGNV
jgi:bifunctional DNA-binding transcriptional regulator/antitoxin component of YhaV-PrlF toxin-antitoxin module